MNLRKEARNRECQARLPGICNFNPETTVLAHFRLSGISGLGHKVPDLLAAWLCSSCHAAADSHKDDRTQLDFAKACFRTQAQLIKEGKVKT